MGPKMGGHSVGVRKGAWTEEEDILLQNCVQKYGEGEWRQFPHRAGLNRCRKSCRLRWLNYLKPNIKREKLQDDEVDMIIRLHKLLGNRWTLIAGRLPGRTANDVKNYWNTYLSGKMKNPAKVTLKPPEPHKVNIIKPQPRTISKNFSCRLTGEAATCYATKPNVSEEKSFGDEIVNGNLWVGELKPSKTGES